METHEYDLDSNFDGIIGNLQFLGDALLWSRDERIVLGAEPFDPRVPLFQWLADRHDVVLHTSWPYWKTDFIPQPPRFNWQRRRWRSFLDDIRVVGVTEAATKSARAAGASDAVNIPHAVDTDIYTPDASTHRRDDLIVLFVGQLEPRKGVRELIDVIRTWNGPPARFWFVGDGPLTGNIRTLAHNKDNVEYFGYVSEDAQLADIYASADVLTLPSYRIDDWEELFGIVVIEAFACGLPVVATDCVGPAEIIDEGETGYVVGQHNTAALESRLSELLSSPDDRAQMSKRAREVAVERYDDDEVSRRWKRVLGL
ncbi:glycosyltransferase [Halopenitus persicus]|uniref:glycosyltransferase n=1 Tax=Halopenitus persicus TaxID=1048396 RepID=UPI0012FD4F98|nr:glycosyltransferase [Halopenitus persicus]